VTQTAVRNYLFGVFLSFTAIRVYVCMSQWISKMAGVMMTVMSLTNGEKRRSACVNDVKTPRVRSFAQ
jgi:hypothetical protein